MEEEKDGGREGRRERDNNKWRGRKERESEERITPFNKEKEENKWRRGRGR